MVFDKIIKLSAPAAFFGYAIFANVSLFQDGLDDLKVNDLTNGEFTQEVDSLYRSNLPHRDVAVGWVGAARYVLLNEGREGVIAGKRGWLFSAEEFRSQDDVPFAQMLHLVEAVQIQLANMGTKLVMVPLPSKVELAHLHVDAVAQTKSMATTYDRFTSGFGDLDIAWVDTRNALHDETDPFFKTDTHWTTSGASAVAKAIAASKIIETGNEEFKRTALSVREFTGDLVSFVTSDHLGPVVGLHAEFVSPYVMKAAVSADTTEVLDLFGSADPTALNLVGTSYSANENWSFAEAIKGALGRDVLNFAQEGIGPVVPMMDYLRNLDPEDAPAAVIWEFPIRYLSDPKLFENVILTEVASDV